MEVVINPYNGVFGNSPLFPLEFITVFESLSGLGIPLFCKLKNVLGCNSFEVELHDRLVSTSDEVYSVDNRAVAKLVEVLVGDVSFHS